MRRPGLTRTNYSRISRRMTLAAAGVVLVTCVSAAQNPAPKEAAPPAKPPAPETATATAPAKTPSAPETSNEAAIRATADAFVKAFNARDAKTIANFFTANGTIIDQEGNLFKGRKAIEEQYDAFFKAHPTARVQLSIKSIDFPNPTTALEDGMTQVETNGNEPPVGNRYMALHVQEDGKWLMASVREAQLPMASNFAHLQELAWLVGNWESKSNNTVARWQYRWIANKSFLQRDFSVHVDGFPMSSGVQIVGWNPRTDRIVSWSFDSSGGYGMATWSARPEGWGIDSTGVTADGMFTESKDHLIRVPGENNVFGCRSVDRKLGEMKIPDIPEVVFDRITQKAPAPPAK